MPHTTITGQTMDHNAFRRAKFIIDEYLKVKEPPLKLRIMFYEWLLSDVNHEEKDKAMYSIFESIFYGGSVEEEAESTECNYVNDKI